MRMRVVWGSGALFAVLMVAVVALNGGCETLQPPPAKSAASTPTVTWEFANTGTKYGMPYGNVIVVINDHHHLAYTGASGVLKEGSAHAPPPEAISNCAVGWADAYIHFYATASGGKVNIFHASDGEDGTRPYQLIKTIDY